MYSLKLDEENWDLDLDPAGNLATTDTEADRLAQDVATACLVWRGESFWDENFGVPWGSILGGQGYTLTLVEGYLRETAETVPGVDAADPELKRDRGARALSGRILINGGAADVSF